MSAAAPLAAQQDTWHADHAGVQIKMSALQREPTFAFYQARGFSAGAIAPYAAACGFAFELRNAGSFTVSTHLHGWGAVDESGTIHFRLPKDWEGEWEQRGVAEPARIAFRWAQFPVEQEFAPGDWIMGMATLKARPKGKFSIVARFTGGGRRFEVPIQNVECAPLD